MNQIPQLFEANSEVGGYQVTKFIGSGIFGQVYCVIKDEYEFALKVCSKTPNAETEIKILKECHHANLVLLLDYFEFSYAGTSYLGIVMNYMNAGTVRSIMTSAFRGYIPEFLVTKIFFQVACALQYLHERGIFHRDVKPENILINSLDIGGKYISVKLTDFGVGNQYTIENSARRFCGTPRYMAPEIWAVVGNNADGALPYGTKSDIFSLGATIFNALTGLYIEPIDFLINNEWKFSWPILPGFYGDYKTVGWSVSISDKLRNCVAQCLCYKPSNRCTTVQIMEDLKEDATQGQTESHGKMKFTIVKC